MEQIKTANASQIEAIMKLKLKTKSNHQNNINNQLFGPKCHTNHKSHDTGDRTLEHAIFKMVAPPHWIWKSKLKHAIFKMVATAILEMKVRTKCNNQTVIKNEFPDPKHARNDELWATGPNCCERNFFKWPTTTILDGKFQKWAHNFRRDTLAIFFFNIHRWQPIGTRARVR